MVTLWLPQRHLTFPVLSFSVVLSSPRLAPVQTPLMWFLVFLFQSQGVFSWPHPIPNPLNLVYPRHYFSLFLVFIFARIPRVFSTSSIFSCIPFTFFSLVHDWKRRQRYKGTEVKDVNFRLWKKLSISIPPPRSTSAAPTPSLQLPTPLPWTQTSHPGFLCFQNDRILCCRHHDNRKTKEKRVLLLKL